MSSVSQSTSKPTDFSYLCRLCLGNDEEDMKDIFPLSEKVEFVTRMDVTVGDGLPTFICLHCIFELDAANNFITRCIENVSLFRSKHITPSPEESIVVKEEILEVNSEHNTDYINSYFEDVNNEANDGQYVDDNIDTIMVTHSTVDQTDSLQDHTPVDDTMTDPFSDADIAEPPENDFLTENTDDNVVTEQAIKKPRGKVHPVRMYTCKLCDESFNMKVYFNLHMRSHAMYVPSKPGVAVKLNGANGTSKKLADNAANNDLRCRVCARSFVRERNLKAHEQTHVAAKRTYDCNKCAKKYRDEFRLKLHVKNHHRTRKSPMKPSAEKLEAVGRRARAVASRSPATTKQQPKPSSIKKTPVKTNSQSTKVGSKKAIVTPEIPQALTFHCFPCDKTFQSEKAMQLHMRRHVEIPVVASFPCTSCKRCYATEKTLLAHASCHVKVIKVIPHKCSKCGKLFVDKDALKIHATSHVEQGRFKCGKCGEEFGNRKHLRHHRRFHADEKPYKCSECGESFVDEVNLLRHFVVHTSKPTKLLKEEKLAERVESPAVKPKAGGSGTVQSCDICGRDFTRKSALVLHLKSHALRKCSECGEEFKTQRLLAEHLPFHNEDNPYKCAECGCEFADEPAMFEHFKSHVKVE